MGETLAKTDILREKGYNYYCFSDEDGYICIGRRVAGKRGRPNGTKKYVDAQGNPISVYEWRRQNKDLYNKIKAEQDKVTKDLIKAEGYINKYGLKGGQDGTDNQNTATTNNTDNSTATSEGATSADF